MMFTIFNSESLWIGTNADRFYEIRNRLDSAGIPYKHKVKNRLGGTYGCSGTMRGRYGSLGMQVEATYQFEVFVYRKDIERAKHCIR